VLDLDTARHGGAGVGSAPSYGPAVGSKSTPSSDSRLRLSGPDCSGPVRRGRAGVEPVLVDIGPDQPGFDLQALDRAWTKSVVAVVG